ncbi:MAG: efflux RND transporter periplasmic adaptor subunit, partial [Clostridiales bacterium]|nr:efflux RND transporter periplasmic adaptor subunit [Clostridiales bacterium]
MKKVNRAWVKTAAIIFLSVLLVLTFFSNTILNRSLPEVAGQYAYGGEISTAVRGKGTVTANEAYSVSVETSREITKVHVRAGDAVEAGQVLFELEPSDSSELGAAIDLLEELQYNYNVKILSLSKDYELESLQYDLE